MTDPTPSQLTSGSSTTASTTVNFTSQTAGKVLLLWVAADDYLATSGANRPESSGWTQLKNIGSPSFLGHAVYGKISTGSETSVQYTIGSATVSFYAVTVVDQMDASPFGTTNSQNAQSTTSSYGSSAITPTSGSRWIVFGSVGGVHYGGSSPTNFSGWTNSYTEIHDPGVNLGPTAKIGLGVAYLVLNGGSSTSTTATLSTAADATTGIIIALKVGAGTTPVSKTVGTTWRTMATTTKTVGTTWRVLAVATKTLATTWDVLTATVKTVGTTWRTLAKTTKTVGTTWNVASALTNVVKTVATTWRVLSRTTKTVGTTWSTKALVTKTVATTWDALAALTKTVGTTWRTRALITKTVSTTWNVASSLTNVVKTVSTTWRTLATTTKTVSTTWNAKATISKAVATTWDVLRAITPKTVATTWDVLSTRTKTVGTTWRTRGLVTKTVAAVWNVLSNAPSLPSDGVRLTLTAVARRLGLSTPERRINTDGGPKRRLE